MERLSVHDFASVPPSRPQAMEGSPEGRVPLALSAQDRPPRRRSKWSVSVFTSIAPIGKAG